MRRSIGFLVRFLIVVMVVAAIPILAGSPAQSGSPYLSALSDLSLGSPALAVKCTRTHCNFATVTCVNQHCSDPKTCVYYNCVISGSTCTNVPC